MQINNGEKNNVGRKESLKKAVGVNQEKTVGQREWNRREEKGTAKPRQRRGKGSRE